MVFISSFTIGRILEQKKDSLILIFNGLLCNQNKKTSFNKCTKMRSSAPPPLQSIQTTLISYTVNVNREIRYFHHTKIAKFQLGTTKTTYYIMDFIFFLLRIEQVQTMFFSVFITKNHCFHLSIRMIISGYKVFLFPICIPISTDA